MSLIISVPKGNRLHIGAYGRCNVGKSSTLNALTRQRLAIVSDAPGTTTDPVEKDVEILPLGPVRLIDTAGIDDEGVLGKERAAKTRETFGRVDVALIVLDATREDSAWGLPEEELVEEFRRRNVPIAVLVNKSDAVADSVVDRLVSLAQSKGCSALAFSANDPDSSKYGIARFREVLTRLVPEECLSSPPIVSDLVPPGEFVVLVTPIDKEAPKGRLILPQVQTIRDLLDAQLGVAVVQEDMLAEALKRVRPALVVTDSQAFRNVASIVPESIALTSFSILFARQKGDIQTLIAGARSIGSLGVSSRVLIAEACAHHPVEEDIGTVKIPRLLRAKFGDDLRVDHVQGRDFPSVDDLRAYDLIVHCGACMFNRREMATRIARALEARTPITNYGLTIAYLTGVFDRAVKPLGF